MFGWHAADTAEAVVVELWGLRHDASRARLQQRRSRHTSSPLSVHCSDFCWHLLHISVPNVAASTGGHLSRRATGRDAAGGMLPCPAGHTAQLEN
jgi:hypothetical protein